MLLLALAEFCNNHNSIWCNKKRSTQIFYTFSTIKETYATQPKIDNNSGNDRNGNYRSGLYRAAR